MRWKLQVRKSAIKDSEKTERVEEMREAKALAFKTLLIAHFTKREKACRLFERYDIVNVSSRQGDYRYFSLPNTGLN